MRQGIEVVWEDSPQLPSRSESRLRKKPRSPATVCIIVVSTTFSHAVEYSWHHTLGMGTSALAEDVNVTFRAPPKKKLVCSKQDGELQCTAYYLPARLGFSCVKRKATCLPHMQSACNACTADKRRAKRMLQDHSLAVLHADSPKKTSPKQPQCWHASPSRTLNATLRACEGPWADLWPQMSSLLYTDRHSLVGLFLHCVIPQDARVDG